MTAQVLDGYREALAYISDQILSGKIASNAQLERAKKTAAVGYSLGRFPANSDILGALPSEKRTRFAELLRVHPRRSASGIVVVTAFSAPFSCPHGTCVFCPGGPRIGTPQSYLPESPGMRTALDVKFDPYLQVQRSLSKYRSNGHEIGKVETVIEGGTFIAVPKDYQKSFVKGVYDGLNGCASEDLEHAQEQNETTRSRCVGLTLESKPDWCRPADIDLMLEYGVTRLEIGVQSLSNDILKKSNRGHTVEDAKKAFQVARDSGLKIAAHMMPGLPGANPEKDLCDLASIFGDESLRPDMTKIYPTLVVPGTALAKQFEAGIFEPFDLETIVELLSEMKKFVPEWHRIMRIQREIPPKEISGGVRNGNLRQLVLERARSKGFQCRCIRCREVALMDSSGMREELRFIVRKYRASGGDEIFGAFETATTNLIAGFVRLRIPSASAHRPEVQGASLVRELRVYGKVVDVGEEKRDAWQHHGLGAQMMGEAERISREEYGIRKILVTSAVGTRAYYRKLGYSRLGPYMARVMQA